MRRNHRINLRVSEQEKTRLFMMAKERGQTVSDYIREVSTSTAK
jgi:uncharacterized protein (DUF1778 family)